MRTLRGNVPHLRPSAYLGDAAEAFANASQVVFESITTRLMCYAHFYKVFWNHTIFSCFIRTPEFFLFSGH